MIFETLNPIEMILSLIEGTIYDPSEKPMVWQEVNVDPNPGCEYRPFWGAYRGVSL